MENSEIKAEWVSAFKAGTSRNDNFADVGKINHAVPPFNTCSWGKALCGSAPNQRGGNGWCETRQAVTCTKCLKKIEQLTTPQGSKQK